MLTHSCQLNNIDILKIWINLKKLMCEKKWLCMSMYCLKHSQVLPCWIFIKIFIKIIIFTNKLLFDYLQIFIFFTNNHQCILYVMIIVKTTVSLIHMDPTVYNFFNIQHWQQVAAVKQKWRHRPMSRHYHRARTAQHRHQRAGRSAHLPIGLVINL